MNLTLGSNEITILRKPIVLKRTRISGKHCYDSQKHEKLLVYLEVKKQWQALKLPMYMEPVHLDVIFIFPLPESYSTARKQMLKNSPTGITSDIDNLLKLLLDSIQGLCFSNDNLVASINAKKCYGNETKTVFSLKLL